MTVVSYITLEQFKKLYPDLDIEQYAVVSGKVKLKNDGTPERNEVLKKGLLDASAKLREQIKKR